jgi:hypothetical protein
MTTHIRIRLRGQPGHFFCGAREFEQGKPNQRGGWRPTKGGCAKCLAKYEANKKATKMSASIPPGTFF